jgi:ATP-dependent RNA helicase RhlE
MPFRALALDPLIAKAVEETGYTTPTPIQAGAIPKILAGKDLIGVAQTGTGKTAAFTLPVLSRLAAMTSGGGPKATRALILAPTRELVVQIEENIRIYGKHLNLRIATVFGGVGERPQIEALRSGADIVIATPGRLIDLMGQGHHQFQKLAFLVLDEADRMLDMGFLPPIRQIVKGLPKQRQTLLFSATLSPEIEKISAEFLTKPETVAIGNRTRTADTVTQTVYEVPRHLKSNLLTHLLESAHLESVLVFSRTKHGADRITRKLAREGISAAAIHGNRSQPQRLRALTDFKEGKVRVLVATDIAARGIDVDGISHVINYDFPKTTDDYIHRIGRTGRAEATGDAISFIGEDEHDLLKVLERFIGRSIPRATATDFNYSTPAPANDNSVRPPRRPDAGGSQQRRGGGGGGGMSNPGRPASRGARRSTNRGR